MNFTYLTMQWLDYLNAVVRYVMPGTAREYVPSDSARRSATAVADSVQSSISTGMQQIETLTVSANQNAAVGVLDMLLSALIPIVFAATAGILIWKRIEARRAIELAMIENGLDPRRSPAEQDSTRKFRALRFGLLLVGVGTGLCVALIIWNTFPAAIPEDYYPFVALTSVSFFSGLALTIYHIVATSLEKR
ncbi:MAG TPA: hypothetical protein DCZ59_03760 [Bacteroidetes bacterium]|nr:hypothetical protein [Bacteroidota bacterium]